MKYVDAYQYVSTSFIVDPDESDQMIEGTEHRLVHEEPSEAAYNPIDVTDIGFCDDPYSVDHITHVCIK